MSSRCSEGGVLTHEILSKHGKELNRLIYLPYEAKLEETKKVIKEALVTHAKPVVACSFGKDSILIMHLVNQIDNSVPAVFNNTGVEFKETLEYKERLRKEWDLEVIELKPEMSFWDCVKEYGYPKQSRNSKTGDRREPKCCKILKRDPMLKFQKEYKPDLVFVGLTSGEGRSRRMAFIRFGNATFYTKSEGLDKCVPIIWWMPDEVFEYFRREEIPLNPAYENYGIDRIGCVPCTGHKEWQKQLARTHPKLYKKISHDMGQNLISDYSYGGVV